MFNDRVQNVQTVFGIILIRGRRGGFSTKACTESYPVTEKSFHPEEERGLRKYV